MAAGGYLVLKLMEESSPSSELETNQSPGHLTTSSSTSNWDSPKNVHHDLYGAQGLDEPDWGSRDPADMDYGPEHPNWPDYD